MRQDALLIAMALLVTAGERAASGQAETPETTPAAATDAEARKRVKSLGRQIKELEAKQNKRLDQLETKQNKRLEQLADENKQLQSQIEEMQIREARTSDQLERERKKLQIYGWMDFSFQKIVLPGKERNNFHNVFPGSDDVFSIGNLNVVVDAQPMDKWRVLFETRLTYSPDGDEEYEVPGLIPYSRTDTTGGAVADYKWGGVVIERAWMEWAPRDFFQVRIGQFFTPYGIWNLDHGSPVLVGVQPPLQFLTQVFPVHQTGLQLHGTFFRDTERLEYALTLSNGRVPISNTDLDSNKAIAGRLMLASTRLGEVKLGFSWYVGQFTDNKTMLDTSQNVQQPILPRLNKEVTAQLDEVALGADLQFDYKGFGLRTEMAYSIIEYDDDHRSSEPLLPAFAFGIGTSTLPLADYSLFAIYNLVFYQLPWIDLRPYLSVEWFSVNDNIAWDNGISISAGLNYRPVPHLTVKAEYYYIFFPNDPEYLANEEYLASIERSLSYLRAQVAVSF